MVLFAWFPGVFRDFCEHTPYLTTVTCSENQPKAGIKIVDFTIESVLATGKLKTVGDHL